ncbi:MAG: hypothetical protein OXP37_02730 [Chloroflexota bacterium]|nr:hypothetical protein [Chloroflexota bacterium]MDE2935735.1 hypothetical protein [Chloroflexota bacterium]
MEFRIQRKIYHIERIELLEATRDVEPDPIERRHFYVVILHGRVYPVRQPIALVTGLRRSDISTDEAYRVAERLGFETAMLSRPRRDPPEPSPPDDFPRNLLVILDSRDGFEVASCPTLEGCTAIAETRREAYRRLRMDVYRRLEVMHRNGQELPRSTEFEILTIY